MNFSSFWTIWFWIAHVVAWSMASHFTMGVPFDMIVQANREKDEGGPWAQATDMLARAQVFRITFFSDRYGTYLTALAAFILSTLVTLGFVFESELARAILSIMGPLTLIYALSIRQAEKARARDLSGVALRRLVTRQRFINQAIGVLAVFCAVALAVWEVTRGLTPVWM